MDIRLTLSDLGQLLARGEYAAMLQRCSDLLENPTLPVNYRVLLLDQKIKALTGLNRVDEAIATCQEELPLMEQLFDPEHPHVPCSERELAIVRKHAKGSSREADALVSLAEHVYELSRFAEADEILKEALALYERNEGRRSLGVSTCLNNLGRSSENQGRNEEGVTYLEEAASIREELLGVHPDSAFTLLNYGTALAATGQYLKAAQTLAHCAALYEALQLSDSPYAAAARKNLDICATALNPAAPETTMAGGCSSCHL